MIIRSIFSILGGKDSRRIDELTERLAHMEGELNAHYAALATIISLMNSKEHEAFGEIMFEKTSNGYPAWLGDRDREKKVFGDGVGYVAAYHRVRSNTLYSLAEQEPNQLDRDLPSQAQ